MHDIAEFLSRHDPFLTLPEPELEELAGRADVEFFPEQAVIFRQGAEPMAHVRVVRRGAVELVDRGHVLDLLGEGELFGHPSMLSGLPAGLEARAHEDTLVYRLPADALRPLLGRPDGLRFLTRSLLGRRPPREEPTAAPGVPLGQPVSQITREAPLICPPDLSIREAAERMVEANVSSVLVRGDDGGIGIVTDRDIRARVIAAGLSLDAPIATVMTFPAVTVAAERTGMDVMLVMLGHGVRHVPVLTPRGEIAGVVRDIDLLAAQTHTPVVMRRSIASAQDLDALRAVAARLRPLIVSLQRANAPHGQISAMISIVADAVTQRLIELAELRHGRPPERFAWLALGGHGRREASLASDLDCAVVWQNGDADGEGVRALVPEVVEGLTACGFRIDSHGVTPGSPRFARSVAGWRREIADLLAEPGGEHALILTSLFYDGRPMTAGEWFPDLFGDPDDARRRPALLRLLLRLALTHRTPTGFMRDIVVESSGAHRGRFDIKRGGLLPVVSIARYASLAAGMRLTSTIDRLEAARDAGTLRDETVRTLLRAFELFSVLRIEHQVAQVRRGEEPDDHLDPAELNPLTRRYLRDAFRAVSSTQRALANELHYTMSG